MTEHQHRFPRETLQASLLAVTLVLMVVGAAGFGFRRWLPPVASEHGHGIDVMIGYLLIATGVLFAIGHVALAYLVWRFSPRKRVTFRMTTPRAEAAWALVPVVLMAAIAEGGVLVLGLPVWGKLYATSAPPEALTIEVTAEQFAWNIRYTGEDGSFGRTDPRLIGLGNPLGLDAADPRGRDDLVQPAELVVPVSRPVRLRLRSRDTLHSLFLPHHRIKQDLVPGMVIEIWFVPTEVGTFEIACAELCGLGHYQMRGELRVLPAAEFERWLEENQP